MLSMPDLVAGVEPFHDIEAEIALCSFFFLYDPMSCHVPAGNIRMCLYACMCTASKSDLSEDMLTSAGDILVRLPS